MFNLITAINESKTLTKHISCEYKYQLDGTKSNLNQWGIKINVTVDVRNMIYGKRLCICKNRK